MRFPKSTVIEVKVFSHAKLTLLSKGGRTPELSNLRSICIINSINKLYEGVIKNKLECEILRREGISDQQYVVKKRRNTSHRAHASHSQTISRDTPCFYSKFLHTIRASLTLLINRTLLFRISPRYYTADLH